MTSAMVTIEDLADEMGGQLSLAEYWIAQAGGRIETDWAGRRSVPANVAEKAMNGFRAAAEAQALRVSRFEQALQDWERQRIEAGRSAFERAANKRLEQEVHELRTMEGYAHYGGTHVLSPAGARAAREAQVEAIQKFERKNPKPRLEDWER